MCPVYLLEKVLSI